MTVTCPEGHQSEATDYCDVCGSPLGAGGSPDVGPFGGAALGGAAFGASALGAPASALGGLTLPQQTAAPVATQTCPHCTAVNVQDALFCESCGYDFTTGTPPMGSEPKAGAEEAGDPEPFVGSEDAEVVVPPEPSASEQAPEPERQEQPADGTVVDGAPIDGPGGSTDPGTPDPEPAPPAAPTAARKPRHTPPSRALSDTWVVEVWIDPDWYAVQQTDDPCPSAGVPDIVLLTRSTALIGRPSGSLGVRPEVDAGVDSAVSRRHAQLTSDGRRWWVEDLGSSNGTFVRKVDEPLPTAPIPAGQRVEIDRDDRIYVGAWTRLALRQATEAEKRGEG